MLMLFFVQVVQTNNNEYEEKIKNIFQCRQAKEMGTCPKKNVN